MAKFIKILDTNGKRRAINVSYIEEVIENDEGCTIYLAFNTPNAIEQDYIKTDIAYDKIIKNIKKEDGRLFEILQIIIEKLTGKTCDKCKHCINGVSCDNVTRYADCVSKVFPVGYEPKDKGDCNK